MRGLQSTIALVVVLAGLGAYIYFVTWKMPEGGADAAAKKEKVFAGFEADKIEEIKVTSAAGDATTLKKEGGAWQMSQPIAAKADESEVSGITTALGSIEVSRVIDENPTNLNDYGLSNPRIEIDFKGAGDKDYRKLLVGDKSPTGGDLFAKRNDEKKVFLIPAFQETSLNRTTFDLREKTVLKFDREKVDGIDVTAGGKTLAVAKDGGDWKITKPVQTRADFGSVEGLVGRLQIGADEVDRDGERRPGRPEEVRPRQAGGDRQPERRQRPRDAAARRQGGRQHRLRARRLEAVGRHRRERAARRSEERRRRLPAQGHLRVPAVQRQPRRDDAQRPDGRVRAGQGERRKRAGQVEARQPDRRRRRPRKERQPALEAVEHARRLVRRHDREDRPRQAGADGHGEVRRREEGRDGDVRASRATTSTSRGPASPARQRWTAADFNEAIKSLDELSK